MVRQFYFGKISFEEVYLFLQETDNEFPSPLSEHVDICSYAKKLSEFSDFSVCREDGHIVGMISCYTNQPPLGYISNICIIKQYQGIKIFSILFQNLLTNLREKGIKYLQLEVDSINEKACSIYQHYGFRQKEINTISGKVLMERAVV